MRSIYDVEYWKELNSEIGNLQNSNGNPLVIGCNYHTTWQSNKKMRFVLTDIIQSTNGGLKAVLKTRTTLNMFTANLDDLIFINTKHNIEKSKLYKL